MHNVVSEGNKILGRVGRCGMSKHTDITVEKFDALMAKQITLRECPKCHNYGGKIIIDMPMYGKEGAYCRCSQCGYETKRRTTHTLIKDKRNRIATPIIEKSLMGAIRLAINDFNGRSENGT